MSRILGQWSNPVCIWFKEEPSQFSMGQTAQSLTCYIMEKPRTGLDECPRILHSCFRVRNSAHVINPAFHDDLRILRVQLDVEDDPAENVRDGELGEVVVPLARRDVPVDEQLPFVWELGVHLYGLRQLGVIAEIIWN